jgi:hypothetical protein
MGSPAWKEFVELLSGSFKVKSKTTFFDEYIPQEAARTRVLQNTHLSQQVILTCTFDGATTAGNETYYSFHATDQDHVTHFVDAVEASDISHTGTWVGENALQVCFACQISY